MMKKDIGHGLALFDLFEGDARAYRYASGMIVFEILGKVDYRQIMATAIGHNRGISPATGGRMYAIVFDLDTMTLEQTYPNASWRNAYTDVRRILEDRGFEWQQGSTYFGADHITAVDCVLAVQELKRTYNWFQPSVRDIRMLRIEENNDLGPALN